MFALVVIFAILHQSQCAKILGVSFIPSISHQSVFQPIWRELSLRGHEVTVFTPNPLKNLSLTNLTEIDMSSNYAIFRREYAGDAMAKDLYVIDAVLWVYRLFEEIVEENLKIANRIFIDTKISFDLIIVEAFYPLVYNFGCRFKVPMIVMSSLGVYINTHDAVGNPTHPVISPDIFSNIVEKFDLYEKICSVTYSLWYRFKYYWYVSPKNDKISKRYWNEHCPYLGDLEKNVSLVLINTNPVLHLIRPNVPNVIEMGQMHLTEEKSLPSDIQEYLEASTQGVVYFNLGSNIKSSHLTTHVRKIILEVLSELPYNVLWKWEKDHLPDKPKNVMIRQWFPQQDVLRHKNIKVFVTQGGLQSIEEAITNGVPMVEMPFFSDQPLNVFKIVKLGIARSIDYVTVTKRNLNEAIIDVAENIKYRKKINDLKDLFSDQTVSGLEKSVSRIEYVLRHKGTKHLRSPAADMAWFEYYFLDIFLIWLFIVSIFVYFVFVSVRFLFKICNCK